MAGDLLIRNATLVDGRGVQGKTNVLLNEGRIVSLSGGNATRVLEAEGLMLCPAFMDPHAHLREPGQEAKEDLQSGLTAAVRGGYSDIVCMPNTSPPLDHPEMVQALLEKSKRLGLARLHPAAALTQGQAGEKLTEAMQLKQAGAVMLTDDGHTNEDAGVLALGLRYAHSWGLVVAVHAEDAGLRRGGVMNEGRLSERLGLPGNPAAAEAARIARDIEVLRYASGRLHIQHLSTRRGLELVTAAKRDGLAISTEVGPHHLTLTENALQSLNPIYKVAPPLRTQEDVEALIEGLANGSIEAIGTDHAPHTQAEKEQDLLRAPSGIASLEVAFALLFTELHLKRGFDLATLIERFTNGPRQILGQNPISLEVGAEASLVLFDPQTPAKVQSQNMATKAKFSPWEGWELRGWPVFTFVDGQLVFAARDLN